MHIRDFHLKFISCGDECALLGALRRLSRLESPQAMMGSDESFATDWIVWSEAGTDTALSLSPVAA